MPSEVSTVGADRDRDRAVEALERELSEAQRREEALNELLRLTSSSPNNLDAVFAAMLKSTLSICEADYGRLYLYDAGIFTTVAWQGAPASVYHAPFRPSPETGLASAASSK